MKITILTFGSRGDVEPYVALGVGLQRAGHATTIVAPQVYADWIRSYGLDPRTLRFDLGKFQWGQKNAPADGRKSKRSLRVYREGMAEGILQACEDYLEMSRGADFVLQAGIAHGGIEIAESFGIPMAFSYLQPFTPTAAFPSFFLPLRGSLGGAYNRFTQRLALRLAWWTYGPPLNRWRASRFGLPPWRSYAEMLGSRRKLDTPNLLGYSPSLLPQPQDWDARHHVTGYWFLDPPPQWQAPPELQRFLDDGPPPVYVGFGSMHGEDPQQLAGEVLRALEMTGQRGLLLDGGGGGLARLPTPPGVMYIDEIPHAWLFPRMAAVVHHGGAGTMANAVRAGVPGIAAPRILDQFAWAELVQKLGIGLRVSEMTKLTAEQLAPAIRVATGDAAMRARAAELGNKVRAEDGVASAVRLIESHVVEFDKRKYSVDPASRRKPWLFLIDKMLRSQVSRRVEGTAAFDQTSPAVPGDSKKAETSRR